MKTRRTLILSFACIAILFLAECKVKLPEHPSRAGHAAKKSDGTNFPGEDVVYRGKVAVGRDVWVDLAAWDFAVQDTRVYHIYAQSQLKGKTMPFGGSFILQLSDASGRVIKQVNSGSMTFRPTISGNYTILIKFIQDYINAKPDDLSKGFYVTACIDLIANDRNYPIP